MKHSGPRQDRSDHGPPPPGCLCIHTYVCMLCACMQAQRRGADVRCYLSEYPVYTCIIVYIRVLGNLSVHMVHTYKSTYNDTFVRASAFQIGQIGFFFVSLWGIYPDSTLQ